MVSIEQKIKQSKINIRQALRDYSKHTTDSKIMLDVSDAFICRLAEDNADSKQELRKLFRCSPAWNEELDALVIDTVRIHEPDKFLIMRYAQEICNPAIGQCYDATHEFTLDTLWSFIRFFTHPDSEKQNDYIKIIKNIAPKAYADGKKPSRIFLDICKSLGVANDNAGSDFQKLYAQFADELNPKEIKFQLFISVNPAHFLTMSNPRNDRRGDTLITCQSFNTLTDGFNNGCSGYARDNCSFIAFTVADPSNLELINNRKTSRQIFAYEPGNGLLLQSRMYSTFGGSHGSSELSRAYLSLVQSLLSDVENASNEWNTYPSTGRMASYIQSGYGFGGYADWECPYASTTVSVRRGYSNNLKPLIVGTPGLCIRCANKIKTGIYCRDCAEEEKY